MLSMNRYGNTCPMCCGDLDDVAYLRTGTAVCLFCGCNAGASESTLSTARGSNAMAFGVSAIAMRDLAVAQAPSGWIAPPHDLQIQTGASIALTESTTH
jgi:hypothetical protein